MLKSMSIRQKFIAFGGLVAVIALAIGAIGYWGISRQTHELEGVVVTSLALRNHMEGDMMHDALRADVLNALHAAAIGKTDEFAAIKTDVADHAGNFREHIDANKQLVLNDEITAAFADVGPKLDAYIKAAEELVALAEKDAAAAETKAPDFLEAFEVLEGALSNVSD